MARTQGRGGLVGGFLLLWFCLGLVGYVTLTAGTLGWGTTLTAAAVALLPAPLYAAFILWIDRFEPEPRHVLGLAFVWGSVVATTLSVIFNAILTGFFVGLLGQKGALLSAPVVAPIVEELAKGVAVAILFVWKRHEFDSVVDGIVYASIVALGFATIENVLYYARGFSSGGVAGLTATVFVRGVMSPFAHPLFTSMFGIGLGLVARANAHGWRRLAPLIGLGLAMALHGIWNAVAMTEEAAFFFLFYTFIWVPIFLGFIVVVALSLRKEARIVREELAGEHAAGLLADAEYRELGSISRRIAGELRSLARRGPRAWRRRQRLHRTASELALLRRRVAFGVRRDGDEEEEALRCQELAALVAGWREETT